MATTDTRTGGSARREAWDSGAAYELYVGRWKRLAAQAFLAWLAVPPGGSRAQRLEVGPVPRWDLIAADGGVWWGWSDAMREPPEWRRHALGTNSAARRDRPTTGGPRDRGVPGPPARRAAAPGRARVDEARAIWNGMIDRQPALIVRAADAGDVAEAVTFARERDALLSVRGGGHNIAGTAVCDGGLMLDLSGLKGVRVDPETRTVRVQPGATLGDLDRATQPYGLVVPGGIVSTTGLTGLTLGGGFGWLTRKWGYTCDLLRSVELVTADGRRRTASADEAPDLFWGLRGGGGNFGVVTALEFDARSLGPTVVAGFVLHPFARAADLIGCFREVTATAPEELTCLLFLRTAPPAPVIPADFHGQLVAGIAACYAGPLAAGERAMRPLKAFGAPLADTIAPKPFTEHQTFLDAGQPAGRRYYWKSEYLASLNPAVGAALGEHFGRVTSPFSSLLLMHLGGASKRAAGATAVGYRDANYIVNVQAAWEDPATDARHVGWARAFDAALRPFSTGTYVNFLTTDEVRDPARPAYPPAIYARLAALKAVYDPGNLFRLNKNIAPRATAADVVDRSPELRG